MYVSITYKAYKLVKYTDFYTFILIILLYNSLGNLKVKRNADNMQKNTKYPKWNTCIFNTIFKTWVKYLLSLITIPFFCIYKDMNLQKCYCSLVTVGILYYFFPENVHGKERLRAISANFHYRICGTSISRVSTCSFFYPRRAKLR